MRIFNDRYKDKRPCNGEYCCWIGWLHGNHYSLEMILCVVREKRLCILIIHKIKDRLMVRINIGPLSDIPLQDKRKTTYKSGQSSVGVFAKFAPRPQNLDLRTPCTACSVSICLSHNLYVDACCCHQALEMTKSGGYNQSVDIFAVGCVIYFMVTLQICDIGRPRKALSENAQWRKFMIFSVLRALEFCHASLLSTNGSPPHQLPLCTLAQNLAVKNPRSIC